MRFVATKTADQLDLQALHRVRERLVGQRTGIINQIRAFLLERGVAVRQGLRFLRAELPTILATRTDVISPRMLHIIEGLADDWHRLDERIEGLSSEIAALASVDPGCERLMTVPGIGPIISSAMVAAIGNGATFAKGRDFGAWLGLVPKQISTGDRTILGKITRRGNRYLRALFVQAAWVVLVRVGPKHWDRYGLKSWITARSPQRAGDRARQQARPHRLGGSQQSANSSASGQTRCRPELLECRAVLGPVKAWPGNARARGKPTATASLDGPCARRPRHKRGPGRRNELKARTKELDHIGSTQ